MRSSIGVLVCIGLLVLAAGCVRSAHPVYPDSSGITVLPDRTVLAKGDDVYILTRQGNTYYTEENYAGGYKSILFRDLGNGHYVAQALTDNDKGYLYALANVEQGELNTYTFSAGKFADREGLKVTKRMDDDTVQIEDWRQMDRFYQVAAANRDEGRKSTYRILDAGDPAQAETIAALVSKADEKRKRSVEARASKSQTPVPSSSDLWSLDEVVDAMTDEKRLRIVGAPSSFEGAPGQPFIQVSCRNDGLEFAIYWGTSLRRLYEESAIVAVDVRFGRAEAVRLGWVGSPDWTTTYQPKQSTAAFAQIGQSLIDTILQNKQVNLVWDERVFHRNMTNAGRLVVRSSSMSGQPVTLEFDLAGYAKLSQAFPARCK